MVLIGLLLSGLNRASLTARALIGDALLIAAGCLWSGFGVLLRKHRLSPLQATAMVSFFVLVTYVPVYLIVVAPAWLTSAARLCCGKKPWCRA